MTLTDDQRATIAEIERTHPQREHVAMVEAVYRAGFAAGLAANIGQREQHQRGYAAGYDAAIAKDGPT